MSQFTNSSGSVIAPFRSPWGSPQIRHYTESTAAATAVIKRGDVVQLDLVVSTGGHRISRAVATLGVTSNLVNGTNASSAALLGIALADSTSDGSTTGLTADGLNATPNRQIPVALFDGVTEFCGFFKTSVTAGADITASSLVASTRGYAIAYDSTLRTYFIDSTNANSTSHVCVITDIPDMGSCGGGPVVFRMISTVTHRSVRPFVSI